MSKNIVICMDGTWNDPSEQTNVYKLFQHLDAGPQQYVQPTARTGGYATRIGKDLVAFYFEGVGAAGRKEDLLGGMTGLGMHERVLHAYLHASEHYEPGDKLWIFGFSRGAWSARSLAGLVAGTGLMYKQQAGDENALELADTLWRAHKNKQGGSRGDEFWAHRNDPPIKLVGVWDTVGAMGVPLFNGIRAIDKAEQQLFEFADRDLHRRVEYGRHALAIDEHRIDFTPTLWNPRKNDNGTDDKTIQQVWFVGGHADVGGGYVNACALSNIALLWMGQHIYSIDDKFPLDLGELEKRNPSQDYLQGRHDESLKPIWQAREIVTREIDASAEVHGTVLLRLTHLADYRPAALGKLAKIAAQFSGWDKGTNMDLWKSGDCGTLDVGESTGEVPVQAARCWNALRLKVHAGERYEVTASGEWFDASYRAGAAGYESEKLKQFVRLRRMTGAKWFSLIAAVHASPDLEEKNPQAHHLVTGIVESLVHSLGKYDEESDLSDVGANPAFEVKTDGYLYMFANDVIGMYSNNLGALGVKVKRVQ